MERPHKYNLKTALSYISNIGDGGAVKSQVKRYAIQAEKLDNYIDYLEEKIKHGVNEIEFAIWLQDNYSQNSMQGGKEYLPKGFMREDFSDNSFPIGEIYKVYLKRMS